MIALVVPVYKNFQGFAKLMASIDVEVFPVIVSNWEDNLGVSKAWNIGLRKALEVGAEVTIISNDDVFLYPGTLQKIVDNVGKFDILSAANYRDVSEVIDGPKFDEHPDFSFFAVNTKQFVDRFGFFDENFSPAYFEDNDMARRVYVFGGCYGRMLDAGMYHVGSVTQNMDGPVVTSEMFEANRRYYIQKWGGNPLQETYSRPFNDENRTIKDW